MIRRRAHPRSKTGCLTCKERHVRCDERLPFCQNCVRLGRECSYTETPGQLPHGAEGSHTAAAVLPASRQAVVASNSPRDFVLFYCAPHHRDIPSSALSIVQQSQQISLRRPIPRSCTLTIVQHYLPTYNYLAAEYKCVQHAVVGFAAYNHYQVTKNEFAEELCIKQTTVALKRLQEEINTFGPENADAVVTASLFLAGTAQDWDQWSVFVDGYSSALNYIRAKKLKTAYPALLTDTFKMRQFSIKANPDASPLPRCYDRMKESVKEIKDSILNVCAIMGISKWQETGFGDLEKLAHTVDAAVSEESDVEAYHKLAYLRTWMFWIDLRRTNKGDEQMVLTAHFYSLVLVVVPLYPAKYSQGLIDVCFKKIEGACAAVEDEELGLPGLLELARRNAGSRICEGSSSRKATGS